MNSFLNSWLLESSTDLHEVTETCMNANQVMDDLVFVGANAIATSDTPLFDQCMSFLHKMRAMVHDKIEFATEHILQYADEYTDAHSRSEVKMASASNWVKIGIWINLIAKGSRNKRIEFQELGISVDLPKAVIVQSLALRAIHLPFDPLSSHNAQNLDCALGGVYSLDLLAIPAPPKRARGWIMRDVSLSGGQIKRLHYPLEGMVVSAALPIKVSLVLPSDVLYASTPRVGWWDVHSESWEEDGISDVVFNQESCVLAFSTMKLTHLAVIQQRDLNYQKYLWHLTMSTTTPNKAHLTLKTEHFECIHLEITDAGCRLGTPQLPQLKPLQDGWMPPGELLVKLARSGISLCPSLEDDIRFGYTPKLKTLEDRVIKEVVSIVSAYEMSIGNLSLESNSGGMKWIGAIENPKQIVFAVREIFWPYIEDTLESGNEAADSNIERFRLEESNQVQHPTSGQYVNVLAEVDDEISGGGVKFRIDRSEDPYDTHVHLKKALEDLSSPDAKDRMENANVLFEFMLVKLLSLLRLFSYSKPLSTVMESNNNTANLLMSSADEEFLSSNAPATGVNINAEMLGSSSGLEGLQDTINSGILEMKELEPRTDVDPIMSSA